MDRIGKPLGLERSEIVRQALRQWLQRHAVERFERSWIAAPQERPDNEAARTDDWLESQAWGQR